MESQQPRMREYVETMLPLEIAARTITDCSEYSAGITEGQRRLQAKLVAIMSEEDWA